MKSGLLCATVAITFLLSSKTEASATAGADQPQVTQEDKTQMDELIDWLKKNGGYVAEGLGFGYENSIRGLVAGSKGFKAGEVIMDIPNSVIMLPIPDPENPAEQDQCAQVARMHEEVIKGEESHWSKYLRMDDSLGVRTVALWDDAVLSELQGLPPYKQRLAVDWYTYWCKDQQHMKLGKSGVDFYHEDLTNDEKRAMWIVLTRGSNQGMIPLWDLMNHHQGLVNVIVDQHDKGSRYKASVDIPPGGTIHNSYGEKESDRIFRDYGFVPKWPQNWSWCSADCTESYVHNEKEGETRHRFVLFPDGVAAIEAEDSLAVCTNCSNAEDFKAAARKHTQALDTLVLERFVAAARVFLGGLPTSVDDDAVLLDLLKEEAEGLPDWKRATMLDADTSSENVRLTDTMVAVEYRMQFKQAVKSALEYAVRELDQRQKEM